MIFLLNLLKYLIYNLSKVVFHLRIFGLIFQSKGAITPDLECDHVRNTRQELFDRTLCHQVLCSNFNGFEEFCQLDIDRKYCSWFFCLTRSDSSTKTCNTFCLSFVYNVSFLKLQIFVSLLSFAWKVLHQEICEWLGTSFFVSQNTRYSSAFVAKFRILV